MAILSNRAQAKPRYGIWHWVFLGLILIIIVISPALFWQELELRDYKESLLLRIAAQPSPATAAETETSTTKPPEIAGTVPANMSTKVGVEPPNANSQQMIVPTNETSPSKSLNGERTIEKNSKPMSQTGLERYDLPSERRETRQRETRGTPTPRPAKSNNPDCIFNNNCR